MKLRAVAITATVLLLAGCSAEPSEIAVDTTATAAPTPTISPTPTWSPTPWPTDIPSVVEAPAAAATPADASDASYDDAVFLAALGTIDPGLARERSLGRAANVCLDIEDGKDSTTIILNMEARFEGGTVPNLSGGQLASLLSLIKTTCD
ncbi:MULTISPECIES: hypothetical protein [Cryobacterium]|uniref:DUF732 domain-containing protein n=1 Tax=Cryobacterium breve TaxID=1259258 RepID=A0ABY2J4G5_9MICO|nr:MULTISPECIES: hypothetical protein [Cryobacterium]TFC92027.1 hypothetical protein E3T20_11980 [Cryobacterium sp. TmT3-12]TFC99834.1 hypothetical protein E3O65_05525 [Cryobacterium breve]